MPEEQAPSVTVEPTPVVAEQPKPPLYKSKTIIFYTVAFLMLIIALIVVVKLQTSAPAAPINPSTNGVNTQTSGLPSSGNTLPAPSSGSTITTQAPVAAGYAGAYKIVYSLESPTMNILGAGIKTYIGEFHRGSKSKIVTELLASGIKATSTTYNLSGTVVSCGTSYDESGVYCKLGSASAGSMGGVSGLNSQISIPSNAVTIGNGTIAGRACNYKEFNLTNSSIGSSSTFFDLAYALSEKSTGTPNNSFKTVACIDQETKLILGLNLSISQRSDLTGLTTDSQLMSYTALSFTTDVSEDEFIPPQQTSVTMTGCINQTAYAIVTALQDGNFPMNVSEYTQGRFDDKKTISFSQSLGTKHINQGQSIPVTFALPAAPTDSYSRKFSICVGQNCTTTSCYVNSYTTVTGSDCFTASANKSACDARTECVYADPLCEAFSCYSIRTKDTCNAHQSCGWQTYGNMGACSQKYCSDYTTQVTCEAQTTCSWSGNACANKPYDDNAYQLPAPQATTSVTNKTAEKPVTVHFSGKITSVTDYTKASGYKPGDVVDAWLTYDSAETPYSQLGYSGEQQATYDFHDTSGSSLNMTINSKPVVFPSGSVMFGTGAVFEIEVQVFAPSDGSEGVARGLQTEAIFIKYSGGGLSSSIDLQNYHGFNLTAALPTNITTADWGSATLSLQNNTFVNGYPAMTVGVSTFNIVS